MSDHQIPQIDWKVLESELETNEGDPEAIIHELFHVYDCLGDKIFKTDHFISIGRQADVGSIIQETYKSQRALVASKSEIRVSAMTLLVVQRLGFSDIIRIMSDAYANLTEEHAKQLSKSDFRLTFLEHLEDPEIKKMASRVYDFLVKHYLVEEDQVGEYDD